MSKYNVAGPSRIPLSVWAKAVLAAAFGFRRSPHREGRDIWNSLRPRGNISGLEHLPANRPFVVVANHFNGPGIWVGLAGGLLAYALGDAVPGATVTGVGVASYRNFKLGPLPVSSKVTEFVFGRFYRVYGVIRMPNVGEGAFARSGGVRVILRALKRGDIVVLFPEGRNVTNFVMRPIEPGVGDLLRLAVKAGAAIIPAAIWRDNDAFSVAFGPPIPIEPDTRRDEAEALTGNHIAQMLPPAFRGEYGETLSTSADKP